MLDALFIGGTNDVVVRTLAELCRTEGSVSGLLDVLESDTISAGCRRMHLALFRQWMKMQPVRFRRRTVLERVVGMLSHMNAAVRQGACVLLANCMWQVNTLESVLVESGAVFSVPLMLQLRTYSAFKASGLTVQLVRRGDTIPREYLLQEVRWMRTRPLNIRRAVAFVTHLVWYLREHRDETSEYADVLDMFTETEGLEGVFLRRACNGIKANEMV